MQKRVADLIDVANIGMADGRRGLGLAEKALLGLAVVEEVRSEELQCDRSTEGRVLSFEDLTHPAAAEALEDLVAADRGSVHVHQFYRLRRDWRTEESTRLAAWAAEVSSLTHFGTHVIVAALWCSWAGAGGAGGVALLLLLSLLEFVDPTLGALIANSLSFVLCVMAAAWYVVPWLKTQERAAALAPLLWLHAFRHVALQIFSAQQAGFAVPNDLRDQIAYGDVLGMALAVAALIALRYHSRLAIPLVWVFVVETMIDLSNAMAGGMREGMMAIANGVTWMILTFYVPVLWTSLALIVWQLWTRRGQPLSNRIR